MIRFIRIRQLQFSRAHVLEWMLHEVSFWHVFGYSISDLKCIWSCYHDDTWFVKLLRTAIRLHQLYLPTHKVPGSGSVMSLDGVEGTTMGA